ncbi:MAG: hypothetical protein LBV65_03710, partial [Desulfovibrio sp.]|nr:hypothetical protein [Desulfovibrio sp.]
ERMPYISTGNTNNLFSMYAGNGAPWNHTREGVLFNSMAGTWGIGVRLKDISFLEDIKHTFRINYMGGTNSPTFAKRYLSGANEWHASKNYAANEGGLGRDPLYMTTLDSAVEFGLTTVYKMYDNFQVYVDANYIATWLDKDVWGKSTMNGNNDDVRDPWNVNVTFVYSF